MNEHQLGLACWGLRELPQPEQLAMARRLGVSELEFSIANAPKDYPLTMGETEIDDVRAMYQNAGIPLRYVVTGNDFTQENPDAVHADLQKVKRVIALCELLGAKVLRVFAGFSAAEAVTGARFDRMAAALTEAAQEAGQHGVTLALELHGGVERFGQGMHYVHSVTTRMEMLDAILERVPQSVQLLMDPANLWAVGVTDPERYYRKYRDRIAYIHIKDFATLPDGSMRPSVCGASALNWKALMVAAREYTGPLMIEYENPEDVEQGMLACLEYIKPILQI